MREPIQVLVFPYRKVQSEFQYAIFQREDLKVWQGIAGGVEDEESVIDAARREANEEAGIDMNAEIIELDTFTTMPVTNITKGFLWGRDVYLVKEFSFGINAQNEEIKISFEHLQYEWVNYENAIKMLNWDSNKTALWELNERLRRKIK